MSNFNGGNGIPWLPLLNVGWLGCQIGDAHHGFWSLTSDPTLVFGLGWMGARLRSSAKAGFTYLTAT